MPGAAVCPIGFVSDHLEVVYDLDTEAREVAGQIGLPFARAATVGVAPAFVGALVDLMVERAGQARDEQPERPALGVSRPCPVGLPGGLLPEPAVRDRRRVRGGLDRAAGHRGQPMTGSAPELAVELLRLAERAARAAGDLIRDERPADLGVTLTKSSPTDVVTVMDQRSERLLRDLLLAERPHDGLLGEEGGDVTGTSGVTWVVDPIDGTVNYLYGIPAYAVSVAAVTGDAGDPAGHQVLAGCVHNPVSGETFTATLGGGAFLDGRRLQVNDVQDLGQCLLATGFGYAAEPAAQAGPGDGHGAAPGAGHPADGQWRARPVPGGLRAGRRLPRTRSDAVGPGRRRAGRTGGGSPGHRAAKRASGGRSCARGRSQDACCSCSAFWPLCDRTRTQCDRTAPDEAQSLSRAGTNSALDAL